MNFQESFFILVCENTLTATKGTLRSHRDSKTLTYLPNTDCTWKIVHSPGGVISVNFTKLNLEKSTNCTKDYVLVRNGISKDSPVIQRLCDQSVPIEVQSSGHEMTIQFVTDGSGQVNNGGFELSYERKIFGRCYCSYMVSYFLIRLHLLQNLPGKINTFTVEFDLASFCHPIIDYRYYFLRTHCSYVISHFLNSVMEKSRM